MALKLKYPKQIFMLRGNHEDRNVNRYLGLGQECARRLNEDINDPNSIF
jgi:protein phosphatase